jgi:hypothetical protein
MIQKKSIRGLLSCVLTGLMLAYGTYTMAQREPAATNFEQLQRQFKDPGHIYGSAPLWVWNTDVTEGKIDSMLQGFKDNAFGGVFIHPRPGLITPYLSDEWHRYYTYAVKKGKALGLDVWIYDENSYPSGFAGGHVPATMPASYDQGQMLHLEKVSKLPADVADDAIVLVKESAGFKDITGDAAAYGGKVDTFYLFRKAYYGKSPWYAGFSYVDLLARGVTERFIEVTMEGYEKHIGSEFGRTVPGVFTDEPNIEVQGEGNIRWTPDLFERFRQQWGYDLVPHLPSLYEETGPWRKVRHNYYQVLLQLFIDRWAKPWYRYTEQKGLEWTGHYWEHGWPNPNHGGDNMAMYAWHQRPAVDMLFNQFDESSPNAQFGNIRAIKELASVANQLDRRRTLSETYGGGGWELTLTDMKRLGDWQYALGVNTLNQHLAHMTLKGARKYDYPQSFSYHNPWWPYYAPQNRYFARLSLALSAGKQVNHLLVIEPTTSAWMYSTYQSANPRRDSIGQRFQTFVTTLERAQSEYDLGSENIIKDHGSVRGAGFTVGARDYHTVIIPPGMENIDRPTFSLLQRFVDQGGRLLVFDKVKYIDGAEAPEAIGKLLSGKDVHLIERLDDQVIKTYFLPEDLRFGGETAGVLHPGLYHHRRILPEGQVLFLANSSLERDKTIDIRVRGKQVLYLDPGEGTIFQLPATAEGASQQFAHTLPPAGSALFFVGNETQAGYPIWQVPEPSGAPVKMAPMRVERLHPNVLTMDFCDVAIGDTLLRDLHTYFAADTVFKHYGFKEGNPWNTSVQYKDQTIRRDTFQKGTGFTVTYHFEIAPGTHPADLRAVMERADLWQVSINGTIVEPIPGEWWLDSEFAVFDAGPYCRTGDNTITIHADRMRVNAEIEPVYLLGDFSLSPRTKGWAVSGQTPLSLGSWKEQGMPFYGHEMAYRTTFEGKAGQGYRLKLNAWKGTAAIVRLNGKTVGHIHYPPHELMLTEGVSNGENKLEIIIVGSLKNTLGPHHGAPRPGMVSPWHWRRAETYPPGEAYDTYNYGLMEAISLFHVP